MGEDVEIEREGGDGGRGVVGRGEEPDAGGERRGEVEGGGVEFGEGDFGGCGLLEGAAIAGDGGEADIEGFAAVEDAPGGAGNFGEHGCFREEDQAGSERDVGLTGGEALGEEHVFAEVLEGEASFAGFAGGGGGGDVSAGGADGDLRRGGGALKPIGEQLGKVASGGEGILEEWGVERGDGIACGGGHSGRGAGGSDEIEIEVAGESGSEKEHLGLRP